MKEIKLSNGRLVKVSDEDYDHLSQFKWHARKAHDKTETLYAVRSIPHPLGLKYKNGKTKRKTIQMHRELMSFPENIDVDHIDGDGLNNTRENLRLATKTQNQRNRKLTKTNKYGYNGIRKIGNKYYARLRIDGKEKCFSGYDTLEQAIEAKKLLEKQYYGDFVRK